MWRSGEALPPELPAKMAAKMFWGAEQQAVSALVLETIVRNKVQVPEDLYYEMIGLLFQIQQSNRQVNDELKAFAGLMDRGGVAYVVVKGQAVAAYYPDPLLREAGDIDYYCDAEAFPKSMQLIQDTWQLTPERGDSHYHVNFDRHDVAFEGHFELTRFYSKRRDGYWRQLLQADTGSQVTVDGVVVRTLSPTLHTLYVFLHLYHHLLELGVGIRQFCDWAVLLHYCRDQIDQDALRRHLKALGMERAYRACGSILVSRLGLPAEEFTYALTDRDRQYAERILDVVFYRGNMGKYNKQSGFSGWKHNIEATGIKVSHFMKFMPLAPAFSCRWILREMYEKIVMKAKTR